MDEVHISARVIDRIKVGALLYPDSETGEALVGVMQENGTRQAPQIYVLETIAPRSAAREWAMFEQGDDWQASIFNWLHENWELYRNLRRRSHSQSSAALWDLPLRHLGDWHKQPGGMVAPSLGDLRTARQFLREIGQAFLLAPIVTYAAEAAGEPIAENTLVFEDVKPAVRIDFWGLWRRERRFVPLKPLPALRYALPSLPDTVWWLDHSERLDLEIAALEKAGLHVLDIVQYTADGMPPLETCFVIHRPGSQHMILSVTPHTYPKKAPAWRLAPPLRPQTGQDALTALYAGSQPVPGEVVAGWTGDAHALIDGVRMIERYLAKGNA
ncbi:MAG: hypothetical protein HC915_08630 [Anaerolineae bacterium]|nr:hypothetical protein [Anaerolineae bacterium]